MAINKVIRKGVIELDLTSDTVTPETLISGTTAHNAAGESIVGTASSGVDTTDATATAADMLSGKTAYAKGEKITGNIPSKTSSDLTSSGATVTVPAGHYASQATKTIASGSAKTPATTITKNPTISVNSSGLITASVSGTQSVTPTVTSGYVSSGTAGTITVSGSATKQLTVQAAQTITPGTSNKTIAFGRYLTGTQTIKGDANLKAENIKSGVSIFGVTGSYEGAGGGGGGSVETCTVDITLTAWSMITADLKSYPEDISQTISGMRTASATITLMKNSVITIADQHNTFMGISTTGNITYIGKVVYNGMEKPAFYISSDGAISMEA